MADEVNQKENSLESPPGEQSKSQMEASGRSVVSEVGVAELESLVAQKGEELTKVSTRLNEFEQVIAGKDAEIVTLKQANDELEGRLTSLGDSLAEAVANYRAGRE